MENQYGSPWFSHSGSGIIRGMEKTFWQMLPDPIIGLAPMDGVGDHPFRHIQKKYGNPDLIITEFTSVEALCHGDLQSLLNLLYDESQRPIVAQIYGKTPRYFRQVAILLCELGFDGIDLNMGCPAKSVANGGCGAGLIRTPDLAQTLIRETRAGIQDWQNGATLADCPDIPPRIAIYANIWRDRLPSDYRQRRPIPVSVKTRIGFETPVVEEWVPRLLEMEVANISLHGRTLRQAYKGQADWAQIGRAAELAHSAGTRLLGNGDVASLADAHERVATYGVDGVLIGRASFGNPFVFCPTAIGDEATQRQRRIQIALEHARLYEQTFRPYERYFFLPMRKHLGWYVKDVYGAAYLRTLLVQSNSTEEVEAVLSAHNVIDTKEADDAISISRHGPVH
jgi:tRNA-dihydrouridine synthase B